MNKTKTTNIDSRLTENMYLVQFCRNSGTTLILMLSICKTSIIYYCSRKLLNALNIIEKMSLCYFIYIQTSRWIFPTVKPNAAVPEWCFSWVFASQFWQVSKIWNLVSSFSFKFMEGGSCCFSCKVWTGCGEEVYVTDPFMPHISYR